MIYRTSRTPIELDWLCPRAAYWGYEWERIGLVPQQDNPDLVFGAAMAEQVQEIKQGRPWDAKGFVGRAGVIARALLTGYEIWVWPQWAKAYEVVSTEQECPIELAPGIIYESRPDTITRRKSDGTLWYGPEDKTTSWPRSILGYGRSIQLHATAHCAEQVRGEPIMGAIVQGIYKGYEKEGKFYHPLAYAYHKEAIPGISPAQWSSKYKYGWERASTSEYPGGVKGWIEKQPIEVMQEVFPQSQPVMLNRPLIKAFFSQALTRIKQIVRWQESDTATQAATLDETFPQHFNQCDSFGLGHKECIYKPLCFNPSTQKFPLTLYKKRVPHHAPVA